MKDTLGYEDFIEVWAKIEPDIQKFLLSLLTHDSFSTTVLDKIDDWLSCYSHLFPDSNSIEGFAKALSIKMILSLDFPDADSSLWQTTLLTLNTQNQMMLRLIPDDTLLEELDQEESSEASEEPDDDLRKKSLIKIVQAAKDEIDDEIYDNLFAAIEKRIEKDYGATVSELRTALCTTLITDEILKEDI